MRNRLKEEPDEVLTPLKEVFRELVPVLIKGGSSFTSVMGIAVRLLDCTLHPKIMKNYLQLELSYESDY